MPCALNCGSTAINSESLVSGKTFSDAAVTVRLTCETVNNLGPQTTFPVSEGILNYNGTNYITLTLWAVNGTGAQLSDLQLVPQMPVLSGYSKPALSPQPAYSPRAGAY